ncbi:MAG TPA: cytochrome c [Gemmatimonadales bacterium]
MITLRRLAPAVLALSLGACDWFTDFKDQPRLEPWESYALGDADSATAARIGFRGQPQMSVPITGTTAPGFWVSYTPGIAQLDSMSVLQNPTAPTPESLENGRKYYQVNCAVCHGLSGAGDGPVTMYGLPVPSIISPVTQGYSDGYLWGIIRNGRGLMPNYNRIEDADRWDVVNYMRGLQGRYAVEIGTPPTPGVTGDSVPGYTETAPTRPAPYFQPFRFPRDSAAATGAPGGPTAEPLNPPAPGAAPATQDSVRPDSSTQPGGRI